ncbi:putative hydrolase or acyltransferase of alpha/beta superfamily [Frankia casuarinae]|uniref:Alpha/beta hydrolase fold n=1 Tax=Frankia casuarinae (strain DSM 45818 / CECT 9043 / HFP020203 / CcI3) TaxID=106370 RepID=Q2J8R5_FRACC|nr:MULTISPECIES: alpha/beta fold hydrolase [Frankia]ABD12327.1 alpha/beta hydrolase fold [Frankia casuarinae]EYT91575.1 putative hydrolase or acyltransferase of alpha/beta superfamily [Frankia casuarinae]KDA44855.1 putative hydrolase or acyltransferase of alpha/beta superfamily [Frankia sp. BMG5.23]KEZ35809.1 putative hydrolase or acyltransferase of alpha/beta superfamily [Frankia sp. CeD]ORT94579.1 hypothetical protein UK99_15855 [Frankia casuarinae]
MVQEPTSTPSLGAPADPAPPIRGLRSEYARVGGHRLHYWTGGPDDGTPVLLWHGFLATGYAWRGVAPALADAGMRVLVIDMLGYGDSDKPGGTDPYSARALAEQVRALTARSGFGAGRPILHVGHDMGAPPALLWAASHPEETRGLVYAEAPTMLGGPLRDVLAYAPGTMTTGSMWWWILPLAPGVPQALIVGREEAFLRWFYDGPAGAPRAFDEATVAEYLRTFSGPAGVLGSMGVYRAAFASIAQTEPLLVHPTPVPVLAVGGERGLGQQVGRMLSPVASRLSTSILDGAGHFLPEEEPERLAAAITLFNDRI